MTPSDHLDATFAALADPTRRAILARLTLGETTVMELAKPFAMSQPAISKHLQVLERAGLISRGRSAQRRPCRIEPGAFAEATGWLDGYRQFWENRFQHLDTLLDEMKAEMRKAPPHINSRLQSNSSPKNPERPTQNGDPDNDD